MIIWLPYESAKVFFPFVNCKLTDKSLSVDVQKSAARRVFKNPFSIAGMTWEWINYDWIISLWTHVNLVLSSLLRIDWSVNPSLCLLNDDSGLCISSVQKRMLFAGFTAVKKTIIQNWFTPHMCREAYWIRSLLQIVSCEYTTARVGGSRPSTIDAWQCFLLNIRDYLKE